MEMQGIQYQESFKIKQMQVAYQTKIIASYRLPHNLIIMYKPKRASIPIFKYN